ncbi:MAG: exodeoxyribonuclease VII small subunit [Patescibacteria group bacterium]|nr:exodeoxyribonuclease VII small subunit [Patescibacteria group bacterium]
MVDKKTFKSSYERLQEISNLLDNEEVIDVDELIKLQDEAKKLYTFCNSKLKDLDKKLDSNTED